MTVHQNNLALALRYATAGAPVFSLNGKRPWGSVGKKTQRPILKRYAGSGGAVPTPELDCLWNDADSSITSERQVTGCWPLLVAQI
jgi:hypothetical protein